MCALRTIAGVGFFLCGILYSAASKAELICIHPVHLTIKELVEKQNAGLISEELLKLNADYLMLKYCAATEDPIPTVSSVALGGGCEMRWGERLGEKVYWATCNTTQKVEPKKRGSGHSDSSMQSLVECCLAYCRSVGCNSPAATKACSQSFLTSTLKHYGSVAGYKQNLLAGAASYKGLTVRECM